MVQRMLIFFFGLCMLSLGIATTTHAELGTGTVSSVALVLNHATGLSMGLFVFLTNFFFFILQIIVDPKAIFQKAIRQLPICAVFGFVFDIAMIVTSVVNPDTYIERIGFVLLGTVGVGLGIASMVFARIAILPLEGVVLAVLDRKWREHLYEMDYLKDGIGLRGMGQRDPLVEYQREGYQMYNSMIEAIKEETVQLLFHIDIKQVATTDEAVDEVEETAESADTIAVASGPDENGESVVEAAEGEVEEEDEDTDAKQAIAESAAASGAGESTLPVAGPAPISHAEGKVPVSKRPKSEELKTPWADGRTFPGTGKNAPCPCGSGRKYKMCHGQNEK